MVFFSPLNQFPAGWIEDHITSPSKSLQSFPVNYSECFSMGGATFSRPSLKATRRVCTVITIERIWLQQNTAPHHIWLMRWESCWMDTEALRASPEVGQGAGKAVRSVWIQWSNGQHRDHPGVLSEHTHPWLKAAGSEPFQITFLQLLLSE